MQKYGAAPAPEFDAGNLPIDALFPRTSASMLASFVIYFGKSHDYV